MRSQMNSCIIPTWSGHRVDLFNPDPTTIDIVDIAHHLSIIPRYLGGTHIPLSVAEHSVKMLWVVKTMDGTKRDQRESLLHDGHEAFTGELARPIKHHPLMSPFRDIEDKLDRCIRAKYGLPEVITPLLKDLDRAFCKVEINKSGLFPFPKTLAGLADNGIQQTADTIYDILTQSREALERGFEARCWGWNSATAEWRFLQEWEKVKP
jgi:hypothetical protein